MRAITAHCWWYRFFHRNYFLFSLKWKNISSNRNFRRYKSVTWRGRFSNQMWPNSLQTQARISTAWGQKSIWNDFTGKNRLQQVDYQFYEHFLEVKILLSASDAETEAYISDTCSEISGFSMSSRTSVNSRRVLDKICMQKNQIK